MLRVTAVSGVPDRPANEAHDLLNERVGGMSKGERTGSSSAIPQPLWPPGADRGPFPRRAPALTATPSERRGYYLLFVHQQRKRLAPPASRLGRGIRLASGRLSSPVSREQLSLIRPWLSGQAEVAGTIEGADELQIGVHSRPSAPSTAAGWGGETVQICQTDVVRTTSLLRGRHYRSPRTRCRAGHRCTTPPPMHDRTHWRE